MKTGHYKGQSSFVRLFLDFAIIGILVLAFVWLICQWTGYEFSEVLKITWVSVTRNLP